MSSETIKIPFSDKIVILRIDEFDGDLDTDGLLKIDYSNILGEALTFPVLMNRIGMLRAQADNEMKEAKLSMDICWATLSESYRKDKSRIGTITGGIKKLHKPSKDEVENAVTTDDTYQAKQRSYFRSEKNYNYIDSLYWAAKSKDKKLDVISRSIVPEEFEKEIIEGVINGITIKSTEKVFKIN